MQYKNKLQSWEEIEKTNWKGLNKNNETLNSLIKSNIFLRSSKISALEGIYNKSIQHFSSNNPYNPNLIHNNIYDLAISKDLLRLSYDKLKTNKGAMTPGTANQTADSVSTKLIDSIHTNLKNHTFKWNVIKKIEIQKPGRAPGITRPLGLPNFTDQMVQNNILILLMAIYEPEFSYINTNFGFRPKKSSNTVIKHIRLQTTGMDYAIEGDIEGAYDNVQHNLLIKILRKRIKDEKFLELIYSALRSGYMQDITYYDSFLGTPQGGIHSPILFNIYMNEFDKYIKFGIQETINNWNKNRNYSTERNNQSDNIRRQNARRQNILNNIETIFSIKDIKGDQLFYIYNEIKNQIPSTEKGKNTIEKNLKNIGNQSFTLQEKELGVKYEKNRKKGGKITDFSPNEQNLIKSFNKYNGSRSRTQIKIRSIIEKYKLEDVSKEIHFGRLKTEIKKNKTKQLQLLPLDPNKKRIIIRYYRYADDWILFLRGPEKSAKAIKNILNSWLLNNLKLKLSPEKTFITNINKNKAHFLGFEIFYQSNKQVIKRQLSLTKSTFQRYGRIQIMPDADRIIKKFKIKNILNKDNKTLSIGYLTVLEDHQIIEKYNQFMLGIGIYYATEISRISSLNYIHYILYFSCLKTLSHKHRSSIKKIINKGYLDISKPNIKNNKKTQVFDRRIISSFTKTNQTGIHQTLLNYNEFMLKLKQIRNNHRNNNLNTSLNSPTIDFLQLQKNNWRTKFKINSMCPICASTTDLQMHHINHIRKGQSKTQTYKGFDKIIGSLNRKQVCVCKLCHNKIHNGEYNSISLKDLIDVRIVAPESTLNIEKENPNETIQNKKSKPNIIINKKNQTYYNPILEEYYKTGM